MTDANTPFDPQPSSPYSAPPDLSAFDDEYGTVQPADNEEVPDGKYQARVHSVKLDRSQKGDPMLKWDLIVLSGQHAGRHIFKNAVITQAALPFVKGDLKTLGLELPKLSELPNHLDQLLDHALEVTKRTKGEYTNVYFNNALGSLSVEGVYDFPKATGGGTGITAGATLYWDDTNNRATTSSGAGANKLIGKCIKAAADADTTVRARMSQ